MKHSQKTLRERVLLLEHTLHGNGQKGVKDELHALQNEVENLSTRLYNLQGKQERDKNEIKERLLLLNHVLQGNGSKSITQQLEMQNAEIKALKKFIYLLMTTILLLIGEESINLIRKLL